MLKTAIAALTVSAAALLTAITATPSFAATSDVPLVIGPQVTITVACPKDEHAVDHSGRLSCTRDRKHHRKATERKRTEPKTIVKPTPVQWPHEGALGGWHHWSYWHEYTWWDAGSHCWRHSFNQSLL